MRRIRCRRCRAAYWEGDAHSCPPPVVKARRTKTDDPGVETWGDEVAKGGCCLAEAGCWILPWSCSLVLLALALTIAIARVI